MRIVLRVLLVAHVIFSGCLGAVEKSMNVPGSQSASLEIRQGLAVRRNEVLDVEEGLRMGQPQRMTEQEQVVNNILLRIKDQELERGFNDSSEFLASHHFFRVKQKIDQSEVFKILQMMPKGALLHGHNSALVSSEWVIKNLTYRPGLIMYTTEMDVVRFTFKKPTQFNWNYVADLRKAAANVSGFDRLLESYISLYTSQPEIDYPDIDVAWKRFEKIFETIKEMITFYPVFLDFHYQLLQELHDDNIMYAEIRTGASQLYDADGRIYSSVEAIEALQRVIFDFRQRNPRFFGAKVIFTSGRHKDAGSPEEVMRFRELQRRFPDFVIGFDIVGQEKISNSNSVFANNIYDLAKGNARFFFHAGETNWLGTPMDNNLIDALLWNTTRIGHGFGLLKHPVLWGIVKNRRIAVEVCPISNQVLKLVLDMRNHPAAFYISQNIPVIISNDDPGFWGVKGLSYDFYYAFMAFYPAYSGLEALKKLVFTSIDYSILEDREYRAARAMLQRQWLEFLDRFLAIYQGKNRDLM